MSLTAALVSKGHAYLSDDLVVLDRVNLYAVPVPTPLILKAGSWEPLVQHLPDLSALTVSGATEMRYATCHQPGKSAKAPLPVKAIVFPRYKADAEAAIVELSAFEALNGIATASCSVYAPIRTDTVARLAAWARNTRAYALTYGSLAKAAAIIDRLLGE